MSWLQAISRHIVRSGLVIVCLAVTPRGGEAAEPLNPWEQNVTVGLGADFSTGAYGTHKRTDTVSAPLTVEWRPHTRLDLQLSLPYIYQSNSVNPAFKKGGVGAAAEGGAKEIPAAPNKSVAAPANQGAPSQTAAAGGSGTGTPRLKGNDPQHGIGDMTLQVGIALVEEEGHLPQLRMLGYCKFPTGDRDDMLGSGEFDEGGGLSLAKSYGELQLYLEGLWIFQGGSEYLDASGIRVRDYLSYTAEIGYQVTDTLVPALTVKGSSPSSESQGGVVEGDLKLSWRATSHITLQGYIGAGFTKASPDFTAGAALYYNF